MAAPSSGLLRVTAEAPHQQAGAPDDRPTLIAANGQDVTRIRALASPPDSEHVVRAAYSVPTELIRPETVFSLELPDGDVIRLPAPVTRAPTTSPGNGDDDAEQRTAPAPKALRQELTEANRRAEDALLEAAAARDRGEALERRITELEESLRERQAALDELEMWRGELERRLASMSTELGRAKAAGVPAGAGEAEGIDLAELARAAAADAGAVAAYELAEAAAEPLNPGA